MEITKTLITLILSLDNAEIKRFQAYLLYKKKKKILSLFNLFVQHNNEEELSYQIRRKKQDRNLQRNKNELLKLLRQFWSDNIEKGKPDVEINSLMNFANVIYEKGLTEEAIELIKRAKEIAKANNLHHLVFHCNRKQTIINWRHYPDQTELLMKEYEVHQKQTINQIETTSRVTYLNQRIYFLFYKGLWTLSGEQLQFLEDASNEIMAILKSKDIEVNYQITMLAFANTHARLIKMDGVLAASYGKKALDLLNTCPQNFPYKTRNLAIGYKGQLMTLSHIGQREQYDQTFLEFTAFRKQLKNPGATLQYQILSTRLLHMRYVHIFDEQMEALLKISNQFLEQEGEHLKPVFLGPLCIIIFELYFCCGRWAQAAVYIEKLKGINDKTDLLEIKFMELICEILLNYEKNNFDFVVNRCSAFRKKHAEYLRYNIAGSLILDYLIKLSKVTDNTSKSTLYNELKKELVVAFSNVRNRSLLYFLNILPWIDSKLNNKESIVQWLQSETNETRSIP